MKFVLIGLLVLAIAIAGVIYLNSQGAFDDLSSFFGGIRFGGGGDDDGGDTEEETRRSGGGIFFGRRSSDSGTENGGSEGSDDEEPSEKPPIDPEDVPDGFTIEDISPLYGQILLSSLNRVSRPGPGARITLSTRFSEDDYPKGVAVTGWTVRTRNDTIVVPQAAERYEHTGVPFPQNIILESGERLVISSDRSPVGSNFQLNLCTGYLEEDYDFSPALPRRCPRPDRSELYGYTTACQDYILDLGTCEKPDDNPPVPLTDSSCRSYLRDTFNYGGCARNHQNDSNFLQPEWRVWLNDLNSYVLDPDHDRVLLFDGNGKLVDERSY